VAKKQTRRSLSITGELYFELMDYSGKSGIPMSQVATAGLRAVLDGKVQCEARSAQESLTATLVRRGEMKPERAADLVGGRQTKVNKHVQQLERAISYRAANGLDVEALTVELEAALAKPDLDAEVKRRAVISEDERLKAEYKRMAEEANIANGVRAEVRIPISDRLRDDLEVIAGRVGSAPAAVLEGAVNGMLDHLDVAVWCRTCLETLGDCNCKHPKTQVAR
jgi:hypothetical protein